MSTEAPDQETNATVAQKRSRWRRLVAQVLWFHFGVLTLIAALLVSLAYHFGLQETRSLARVLVESLASDALRGDLEIGRVDELTLGRIRLTNVVLYDDMHRPIIAAEEVTAWPDLARILQDGTIRIAGGRVVRPFIHLHTVNETGTLDPMGLEVSLVRSFLPTTPGDPNGTPTHILIDGLRVEGATVFGDAPRFPGLRVENLNLAGRIDIEGGVHIQVFEATGQMVAPYEGTTEIDHVALDFTTEWESGLNAYIRAHREGTNATARVRVTRPGGDVETPPHIWVRLAVDPLDTETLPRMGFPGTESLLGTARGHAILEGEAGALRLQSYLETDGGPVRIEGLLGDTDYTFTAHTAGANLERIIDGVPEMRLTGSTSIAIDRADPEHTRSVVSVDLAPLFVGGYAVPALRGRARLDEGALILDEVSAPGLEEGAGGTIGATGRIGYDGSLDLHVNLDVTDIGRDPNVARLVPGAHGAVQGQLNLQSGPRGSDMNYEFDVDIRNFRYSAVRARRLAARGFLRGDIARPVTRITTHGQGLRTGTLTLGSFRGTLGGGPSHYDIEAHTEGGSPLRSVDLVATARPNGTGAFDIRADRFVVDAGVGPYEADGALTLRVGREGVRFDHLVLRPTSGTDQRISATGSVGPRGANGLRVELHHFDLVQIRDLVPDSIAGLRGSIDALLAVDGSLQAPHLALSGNVNEMSFDGLRTAHFAYDIHHDDGVLRLRIDGGLGDAGGIAIEGPIDVPFAALTTPSRFADEANFRGVRVAIDQVSLAFITRFFGDQLADLDISGKFSFAAEMNGTLRRPNVPSLVVILDRFGLEGWTPLRIKLEVALQDENLRVQRLWVADVDGEIALMEGRFVVPLQEMPSTSAGWMQSIQSAPWSLAARLEPRLLEDLPRPFSKSLPQGIRVGGQLTARGGPSGIDATFDATAQWIRYPSAELCTRREMPLVQLHGRTVRHPSGNADLLQTEVEAGMYADGRRVAEASATAPTPLESWITGGSVPSLPETLTRVALLDFPLGRLPWTCASMSGRASGDATFVLFSDTPRFDSTVEIQQLRIRDQSAQAASQPFHLSVAARTEGASWTTLGTCAVMTEEGRDRTPIARCPMAFLDLDEEGHARSYERARDSSSVPLEGEAILRAALPVHFTQGTLLPDLGIQDSLYLSGQFSEAHMAPLLAFVPGIAEADAVGDGTIEFRAVRGQADLSGGLDLSQGHARIISLGQHLREMEGLLRFTDRRIIIDEERQLRASDPAGRIAVDGEFGFEGLVPTTADLHVFPDNFPFRREGAILASLAGHSHIVARFGADGLAANIETSSLEVRLPDRSAGSVLSLDERRDVLVVGEDAAELGIDRTARFPYRIHVDASQPFVVRRSDFEAQVTAQLDIVYDQPDLTVTGSAVLRSGNFEVFGKRFRVQRGSLLFLEEAPLDPVVDLVASYPIPGRPSAAISIEAGGQLSDLSIAFTSTETGDVGEIIAMLVSGSSNRSTEETAQEAGSQAANFMAGLAFGVVTLALRRELGDIGEVVPAVSIETVGNAGTLRARAFWDASFIIPDFLREIVIGASVEGFFTSGGQGGTTGGSSASGGVGGGFTIELLFPYGLSLGGTFVPPQNGGLDLLWQP
jgi:hypothetical protein